MNAKIIAIGDEILQGQTLNTNGNFLAQKLTELSFHVDKMCAIGDNKPAITKALNESIGFYNLVIITGGLGPTSDDITKKVLSDYFDGELIENEIVLQDVKKFVEARGFGLNENNRKQALVPSTCELVRNPNGTAAGMLFEKNNTVLVSMPGVPFEMRQMFDETLIPLLKKHFEFPTKCIKFVHTLGIPESVLSHKLEKFEAEIPDNISMAYLPSPEDIKIRLSAFGGFQKRICEQIDELITKLQSILGNYIFGYDDDNLETVLSRVLKENKKTVATAESCTGGRIGHKLTLIPGSSEYFNGGVISYSNEAKIYILGVKEQTIEQFGAVSEQTVVEMANGARKLLNVDFAVAVSGIAGPDGGSEDKPVGTTWIAVASADQTIAKVYKFGSRRDINIRRAAASAMHLLLNFIQNKM
ncbi:MAG: competence/damage-inducible protein A [Bacteroidales bacterium]|nr:competence/damage-inducible protein A [Bacteroidales bacterium]